MNASELGKELDKGRLFPLYFLHGQETYLMEEARERIESLCLMPKGRDFNYDLFLGGEISANRVIDVAKTLPMMSPWRLVVVKDAHLFNNQEVKVFIPYLENPSPTTCLILLGGGLGSWKGCIKILESQGRVVSFPHPRGGLLTRHIVRMAKQMGKEMSSEAAAVMGETVGNHLGEVCQEVDKVASYVGSREEIGIDDVEAVVSRVRTHTVFDLTRAMGMKNRPDALKILNQMLESGEPHLKILAMMVRQFRLIWVAKEMRSLGNHDREIGKALNIPAFVLPGFLVQLNNFTERELVEGYRRFFETDVAFKSRSTSKKIMLENLVISLCQ